MKGIKISAFPLPKNIEGFVGGHSLNASDLCCLSDPFFIRILGQVELFRHPSLGGAFFFFLFIISHD